MGATNRAGLLIAIEGATGSGKTFFTDKLEATLKVRLPRTRIERLGGFRERAGFDAPALTKFLNQLMLYYRFIGLPWLCETTLLMSEQAYNLESYVMPAFNGGAVILYENYSDALIAYQMSRARDLGWSATKTRAFLTALVEAQHTLCQYPRPDMVVYLSSSIEIMCQRLKERDHNAVKKKDQKILAGVIEQYEKLYSGQKCYRVQNGRESDLDSAVSTVAQRISALKR